MNKLDYIDALNFDGNGTISDIFQELGRMEAPTQQFLPDDQQIEVELKATTVRVPVDLLGAFDATLTHFKLSRQDAFAYMLYQFISDSVSGYCFGQSNMGNQEASLDAALVNFDDFINSMPKEHQDKIQIIASDALNKKLGGDYV